MRLLLTYKTMHLAVGLVLGAFLLFSAAPSPTRAQGFIWAVVANLTGNAGDPITKPEDAVFTYTVEAFDKDTTNNQQYFDSSLLMLSHEINSMSWHSVSYQGDNIMNGTRYWNVSGDAVVVTQDTIYYDRFRFDDNPQYAERNDDASPWCTKSVIIQNVP